MIYPDDVDNKKFFLKSQQEIFRRVQGISGDVAGILRDDVKPRRTIQSWIQERDRAGKGTLIDGRPYGHPALAARAKRRGHPISAGYLDELANGESDNPTPLKMRAIAVAYAAPLEEVVAVCFDFDAENDEYNESAFKELWALYDALLPAKQKAKQAKIEMLSDLIKKELQT